MPADPQQPEPDRPQPRLLYVVTEDWAFLSHRLPMARAARDAGYEVHVATRINDGLDAIRAEGFVLHPIAFARGSLSPRSAVLTILLLRNLYQALAPDIVHHVGMQICVFGMIAGFGVPVACVNAFIGLGYAFTSSAATARGVRLLLGNVIRFLSNRGASVALVQNPDDAVALQSLGIDKARIVLIPGSGVDVERFKPLPEPEGPPTFGFVGRLLDDKGIRTLVAAHRLLRQRLPDANLLIAGTPDLANPASVSAAEVEAWNKEPGISCLGQVANIAGLWARAHVAVLPSRREGLPLSLMEAAACGRAMIAADVPGCREIVIDNETGLLVPVDDAAALAQAMERLARDGVLRARYAAAARQRVVDKLSAQEIGRQIVELYRRVSGK
jgi:glycosyltransferase involved in cell wall biosynthesis